MPITNEDVAAEVEAEGAREVVGAVMARWYVEQHGFEWPGPVTLAGHTLVRGDDCCPRCKEKHDADQG